MNVLKVGVIVNATTPPKWTVTALELFEQHELIQIVCIMLQSSKDLFDSHTAPLAGQRRICEPLYKFIDKPRFPTGQLHPAPLPESLLELLNNSSTGLMQSGSSVPRSVDVMLHFGDTSAALPLNTPKAELGIWFINQDNLKAHIEHSFLSRSPLLWIHLWKWTDETTREVSRVASHALPMQSFSITDMETCGFACLPMLILSRLNWLARGVEPQQHEARQISPELTTNDAFPTSYQPKQLTDYQFCLRTVALFFAKTKQRLRNRLQHEQWQLGFLQTDSHATELSVAEFNKLEPPAGIFWADPQLMVNDEQIHVFFEELQLEENKGRIVSAVLTADGFAQPPVTVLDEPYHLSYPFVFKHEGEHYMIPETASRRTISLYKAKTFPGAWEHVCNLMEDIDAADTNVFRRDGLWWMMTNGISHSSVDERDQLFLFFSENLFSANWHPHPLNPIVNGVDRARMAGPLYEKNGELFRPSQYGAYRYGYGLNISRVTKLSTTDYQETVVSQLTPEDNSEWVACHTAVHADQLVVIDRLRHIRKQRDSKTPA